MADGNRSATTHLNMELNKDAAPQPDSELKDNCSDLKNQLTYKIEDNPSWFLSLILGFQYYLTNVGSTIAVPLVLCPAICISSDDPIKGTIISTVIFLSGISTVLQSALGVRLPIVQGSTFTFLVPALALVGSKFPSCDQYDLEKMSIEEKEELWGVRIRDIQGAMIMSSLMQIIISCSGLLGFILKWISPLTIAPTVALIGISLFSTAAEKCAENWAISLLTILILIIFTQYMADFQVPILTFSKKKKFHFAKMTLFSTFPVLIGLLVSWGLCAILTSTDVFPEGSLARTDSKINLVTKAPWFYIPYPFQFGIPTVSLSGVLGMFAGCIASMVESVGDYYACARICCVPAPPKHAVNRGIAMEGFGNLLAGIWGTGNGMTSYSENIGAIRITRVASRRVIEIGGVLMIFCGIIGKFGGMCASIPEPIIGGLFFIVFSTITAVGLSNIEVVDMGSSRNIFILGFSLFTGLAIPRWLMANSGAIQTGSPLADQLFTVLLSTPMLVGGAIGFFLDNTIKGTPEERGLHKWRNDGSDLDIDYQSKIYDFPYGMGIIKRMKWTKYIPISPTYVDNKMTRIIK